MKRLKQMFDIFDTSKSSTTSKKAGSTELDPGVGDQPDADLLRRAEHNWCERSRNARGQDVVYVSPSTSVMSS